MCASLREFSLGACLVGKTTETFSLIMYMFIPSILNSIVCEWGSSEGEVTGVSECDTLGQWMEKAYGKN